MEGYQNIGFDNFDPASLAQQTASVTQFVVVADISGSVYSYVDAMNAATQDLFMRVLKNSHKAAEIVVKSIFFNDQVIHNKGFIPIVNLPDDHLQVKGTSGTTALYQAVLEAFEHVEKYRLDLENQGVDVRTNIFIISDGDDNKSSLNTLSTLKQKITDLRSNEAWANTFTVTYLGVGKQADFENSCKEMGLDPNKCLVTVGNSAEEIRKVMGVVSQSVSSSSQGAATVNF